MFSIAIPRRTTEIEWENAADLFDFVANKTIQSVYEAADWRHEVDRYLCVVGELRLGCVLMFDFYFQKWVMNCSLSFGLF